MLRFTFCFKLCAELARGKMGNGYSGADGEAYEYTSEPIGKQFATTVQVANGAPNNYANNYANMGALAMSIGPKMKKARLRAKENPNLFAWKLAQLQNDFNIRETLAAFRRGGGNVTKLLREANAISEKASEDFLKAIRKADIGALVRAHASAEDASGLIESRDGGRWNWTDDSLTEIINLAQENFIEYGSILQYVLNLTETPLVPVNLLELAAGDDENEPRQPFLDPLMDDEYNNTLEIVIESGWGVPNNPWDIDAVTKLVLESIIVAFVEDNGRIQFMDALFNRSRRQPAFLEYVLSNIVKEGVTLDTIKHSMREGDVDWTDFIDEVYAERPDKSGAFPSYSERRDSFGPTRDWQERIFDYE